MIDFIASTLDTSFTVALIILVGGSLFSLSIYLLPSLIAFIRKCPSLLSIFALNLFLGWSFIGWVASLVWALRKYDYSPSTNSN